MRYQFSPATKGKDLLSDLSADENSQRAKIKVNIDENQD